MTLEKILSEKLKEVRDALSLVKESITEGKSLVKTLKNRILQVEEKGFIEPRDLLARELVRLITLNQPQTDLELASLKDKAEEVLGDYTWDRDYRVMEIPPDRLEDSISFHESRIEEYELSLEGLIKLENFYLDSIIEVGLGAT